MMGKHFLGRARVTALGTEAQVMLDVQLARRLLFYWLLYLHTLFSCNRREFPDIY